MPGGDLSPLDRFGAVTRDGLVKGSIHREVRALDRAPGGKMP
jgi:hypothetical protein